MSVAQEVVSKDAVESFEMFALGGPILGTNRLKVRMDGVVRIGYSDTIDRDIPGVGSFVNRLSPDDLKEAKQIHHLLCENEGLSSMAQKLSPVMQFAVMCLTGRKEFIRRGFFENLPSDLYLSAMRFRQRIFDAYIDGSRAEVKLDVSVSSIERQSKDFNVYVKLINSGDYAIEIPTPRNDVEDHGRTLLSIQGKSVDNGSTWNAGLLPSFFVNEVETSGDTVTIPARRSLTFKFLVVPNQKVKAGTYTFNAQAIIDIISREFPVNAMGLVDFHSDYQHPTKIVIDRDYPSTPEEWKDYESRKAKTVSPVPPGASIIEPGYYRAASGFGTSALLKSLNAGTPAPDAPADIQFAKWHWAADLAYAVTCTPGEACPRDGRWLLCSRSRYYGNPDQTHTQYERSMRVGEPSPVVNVAGVEARDLYWTWLGA